MASIDVDMSEFSAFFQRLGNAAKGDFKKELELFLEGLGNEFLQLVQDEFIHRHRNKGDGQAASALWSSFVRDGDNNVWKYSDDNMTLEVGTELDYAAYANYGHRTLDPSKEKHFTLSNSEMARFVPGYWNGDRFVCDPSADGGMVLKYQWVEGIHFWEAALHAMEHICPVILETKLQNWLDNYFGG